MRIFSKLLPASKLKLVISSIGVLALVVFSAVVLYESTKADVTLVVDGEKETYQTHVNTVEELLEEVDVTVGKHDVLSHELNAAIENGMGIEYKTARQVTVSIDGEQSIYYTVAETVGEFLEENQLTFSDRDDVSHKKDATITDGLTFSVEQAFQVTINDGVEEKQVWTTGGTIQNLLDNHNIILNDHDKVEPTLDENVQQDTEIDITRIEIKTVEVEESIEYKTETKQSNELEKGKQKVVSEGKNGTIVKTYEVTLENGEEIDRELIEEKVLKESQNRVVAVGTREPARNLTTLSSGTRPPSGTELTMTASAFTAFCNGCSGYTATGINLKANPNRKVIAVDPNVIPLGTKVWVEGYGEAIAGDTGGSIRGNRIDVHVPTKSDAYRWGVRTVKVVIID
ncbi:G5 and 3D domain-containing protein [Ornithinibacillus halophilus]|uniref:Uncharacterized conserved protein YabE, contains G5 and tandem DUF348 domains n=1 Tax=Ornithinibacillus halophilus TaxID=930117 RepID=A0A1M5MFB9_9BACI|nr:G5 and 3D domain-containing protein [Ornithinibacillus halophilus]SHG75559.1 Uncharacterized conserved protein YabE, contains G5 and tandem DUF348 domains [Ornithinibacillus halophilus]